MLYMEYGLSNPQGVAEPLYEKLSGFGVRGTFEHDAFLPARLPLKENGNGMPPAIYPSYMDGFAASIF